MYASLPFACPAWRRVTLAVRLRDAEVGDLHVPRGGEEDVLRRDVAMHDAERRAVVVGRFVRRVEAGAGACDDARPRGRRDRPATLPPPRRTRWSDAPSTHSIARKSVPSLFAEVERLAHVRVAELRRDARLVEEHRPVLGLLARARAASS